jgi:8-amino-7-oxononanoate synthase
VPPLPPLDDELATLAQSDRLRSCALLDGASRIHTETAGRQVVAFCSNDYLGLAGHPALASAAAAAMVGHGFGAGASRLVSGEQSPHRDAERGLARLVALPAALLYSTGYQANLGVLAALAGAPDLVVSDRSNHASIIDGARLSRAKVAIYDHADVAAARAILREATGFRRRLLVTESLFSMDGDTAPLAGLADVAREHDATLIVDEAHALGALGPAGAGLCAAAGVTPDVLVGTLGKSLGSFGGFVAGADVLRAYLVNRSRSFIYTTAPPAPLAAATAAAVDLVLGPEGDARRARLSANCQRLRAALTDAGILHGPAAGPIFPILVGPDQAAVRLSRRLFDLGLFVPAIRPPTVPEGTARLRVTVSADHQPAEIDRLAAALAESLR